jgi:hypothetical protein
MEPIGDPRATARMIPRLVGEDRGRMFRLGARHWLTGKYIYRGILLMSRKVERQIILRSPEHSLKESTNLTVKYLRPNHVGAAWTIVSRCAGLFIGGEADRPVPAAEPQAAQRAPRHVLASPAGTLHRSRQTAVCQLEWAARVKTARASRGSNQYLAGIVCPP